jgi:O-glycosyl hydrolase
MNKKITRAVTVAALAVVLALVSGGCQLSVNDPVRFIPIVEPYISVQPQSYSFNVYEFTGAPTLRVEVTNWKRLDGKIGYQWYSFANMEEYCTTGGTPIRGQTGTSYTPYFGDFKAGDQFFYYVVVTNDFPDGTDKKKALAQSEVAIISFYDNTMAPYPVITKQPIGGEYILGRDTPISALEVRATVAGNGTLSYAWYSTGKTRAVTGGTRVSTDPLFSPSRENLDKDENYFYVVVTNNVSITTSTPPRDLKSPVTCPPVSITLLPGERASTPRITEQPQSKTLSAVGQVMLSVTATTNDGGVLSYQWYSSDKAAATLPADLNPLRPVAPVPTEIQGATGRTYTLTSPAIGASAFYFVRVTNYNENVVELKDKDGNFIDKDGKPIPEGGTPVKDDTKFVDSKIVTVRTATAAGTTGEGEQVTIDILDPTEHGNLLQYIRGYGGMEVAWNNFPETYKEDTEMQYNPDWGFGYNILRIMIVPPGSSQGNYTNHSDIILGRDPNSEDYNGWSGLVPKHRPQYIENVKIVNKYNGYVLASPWTPPKEWKENNSINSGGILIPTYYKAFATYLREFCQFMYYQGAPVYAVSIANEPNYSGGYDGCEWRDGDKIPVPDMMNFFLEVGQFTQGARGYGGGKSTPRVLIVNGESANTPSINGFVLGNATTRAVVDFYARHVYGSQQDQLWSSSYASWEEGSPFQTECWMTEHNINSANSTAFPNDSTWNYVWRFMNDVDLVIRQNHENAFVWWASKRFYSFIGDGQAGTRDGNRLPRGYGLSHFAKYTNETTRIKFDIDGTVTLGNSTTPLDIIKDKRGEADRCNVNQSDFNLDGQSAKITAYVTRDGTGADAKIKEISMVMFTPTSFTGTGGYNLGKVRINMPLNLTIESAYAHKSTSASPADLFRPEEVSIASGGKSAYVTLNRGEILSVRFTVSQTTP